MFTYRLTDGSTVTFEKSYGDLVREATTVALTGSVAYLDDVKVTAVGGRQVPLKEIVPPDA